MNYNATVFVRIDRLNWPVASLFARQFGAFRLKVVGVPGDVAKVFLRLVSADGASFRDFGGVALAQPGEWRIVIPDVALETAGDFRYELHGESGDGNVALGRGRCEVLPFTAGGEAPAPGAPVTFAKMPTVDGGWVHCVAVMDETGEYTYEFKRVIEDGEK
jgi:hypothetical protein